MVIEFPESLPISRRKADIMRAIADHQVVVICGETGSGKTTQLPKMLLEWFCEQDKKEALIGHTQPRRLAASSVARRIATELKTSLGDVVGYKVRFQDRASDATRIKLMTDGILLAETQTDPLLQAYDAIVIDEAHERSLNIDFLLGYFKKILPQRPDLKLVITSATIDAESFAEHFSDDGKPAPVLLVSGRSYPVEKRWRPFEESRDYGLNDAIVDAVHELWSSPGQQGDILIFLPGEREIRESAAHLRKALLKHPVWKNTEILPLFARLSQAQQEQIFQSHDNRRIVLATNVAETSLTVPGIRHVIDVGTARVKRYSLRSKVERLQIEPISQAAADQRAGRCGRVADGVCIRLYDEMDFARRPKFTDAEILRSSLAAVILRMKALHLLGQGGAVEDFPFLQAPSSRAIADGEQQLLELGALSAGGDLTTLGRELARLPLDPRLGRMILAGRQWDALQEVLIVASALSMQDVRDRPFGQEAQADRSHARFRDDASEFCSTIKLWHWVHDSRGGSERQRGKPTRRAMVGSDAAAGNTKIDAPGQAKRRLSVRQHENLLRKNYIHVRRVREWRDIHRQLHGLVRERGWSVNARACSYEVLHQCLLTGLLGNIGLKLPDEKKKKQRHEDRYQGARGIRFYPHPGTQLGKQPGRWIVCAELVETTRLYGRQIANIDPGWLTNIAGHLLQREISEPHWDLKMAQAVVHERASLYGLPIYHGRRKVFAGIDPAGAREVLIREGLMGAQWPAGWSKTFAFLPANRKLLRQIETLEHKSRRQDILVDEALIFSFYDKNLPTEVVDGQTLQRWWRQCDADQKNALKLKRHELMRHEAAGISGQNFPGIIRLGSIDCVSHYLHEPSSPLDGLSVNIPLFALNQVSEDRAEWLVPGMLREKLQVMLKSLPQKARNRLQPLSDCLDRLNACLQAPERFAQGNLTEAFLSWVQQETGVRVSRHELKTDAWPLHVLMNFRVLDEHGSQVAQGRNLGDLKSSLGRRASNAFKDLAQLKTAKSAATQTERKAETKTGGKISVRQGRATDKPEKTAPTQTQTELKRYTDWSFGDLPERMEWPGQKSGVLRAYPALLDQGDAVVLQVFDEPDTARQAHHLGLRRLFALQVHDLLRYLRKNIPDLHETSMLYLAWGTQEDLLEQIADLALERTFMTPPWPDKQEDFEQRLQAGRPRLILIAGEVARLLKRILQAHAQVNRRLRQCRNTAVAKDIREQLQWLMPKAFLRDTPWPFLNHFERYLQALVLRLEKWPENPARDADLMKQVRSQEQRYRQLLERKNGREDEKMQELRWMLQELRVSFFAQKLGTYRPVSIKRLEKSWAQLQ